MVRLVDACVVVAVVSYRHTSGRPRGTAAVVPSYPPRKQLLVEPPNAVFTVTDLNLQLWRATAKKMQVPVTAPPLLAHTAMWLHGGVHTILVVTQ